MTSNAVWTWKNESQSVSSNSRVLIVTPGVMIFLTDGDEDSNDFCNRDASHMGYKVVSEVKIEWEQWYIRHTSLLPADPSSNGRVWEDKCASSGLEAYRDLAQLGFLCSRILQPSLKPPPYLNGWFRRLFEVVWGHCRVLVRICVSKKWEWQDIELPGIVSRPWMCRVSWCWTNELKIAHKWRNPTLMSISCR